MLIFTNSNSFKSLFLGIKHIYNTTQRTIKTIKLNKILVVTKLTRYEFECLKHQKLNDKQLEKELRTRGTNFERLLHYHNLHKKFECSAVETLRNMGLDVDVVNRLTYSSEKINWGDVVMPIGGDGTFLLAASRVRNNQKPVIGLNSVPSRSEGHLCLPKNYSSNVRGAIEKLEKGEFEWLLRSRITTRILSPKEPITPRYLHEVDHSWETVNPISGAFARCDNEQILPVLALNEVFMGEMLSARVSHLQMRLNGSTELTNMKCSGVCICTGTGSTSWNLSINRISVQTVGKLLRLMDSKQKEDFAITLADKYNKNLIFAADDTRLRFTIRDLISGGVWPQPKGIQSSGFANKIEMKSNCYDASLVVDGGFSFPFNDGTIVIFETKPEDSLRTVILE